MGGGSNDFCLDLSWVSHRSEHDLGQEGKRNAMKPAAVPIFIAGYKPALGFTSSSGSPHLHSAMLPTSKMQ